MESVKLRHPKLEGRTIEVPSCAVSHHKRSGWVVVGDERAVESKPAGKRAVQKGSEG